MFGVTSGRYLQDISLMDPENQALVQGQVLSEFGLGEYVFCKCLLVEGA